MKRIVPESKVLQMPRRVDSEPYPLGLNKGGAPLSAILSGLRSEFNSLGIRLAREYGTGSQVVLRAEQIANAVQRLEWALEREDGDSTAG